MNLNYNLLEAIRDNNFKYRDDQNNTILHLIIKYNLADDIKIKELILLNSTFINIINNNHETALFYLTDYKLFDWIITNTKYEIRPNINGITIIHMLIKKNKLNLIKKLIKIKPEILELQNNNILCQSIIQNNNKLSEYIISNYSYVINIYDEDNITPFLYSIEYNNLEIFKLLIKYNVDINYTGLFNEFNPLIIALYNNQKEMIEIMLNNKININMINSHNETFLHSLFINEIKLPNELIIKIILKGDLLIKNIYNETPLDYIKKYNHYNKFDKIIEKKLELTKKDKIEHNVKNRKKFILIQGKTNINYGLYNSTHIYNSFYLINLLKKYNNLTIPLRSNSQNKIRTENLFLEYSKNTNENNSINILKDYFYNLYEATPIIIIWKDENNYYIDKHLKFYIKKCLLSNKRFILLKLILIISSDMNHSNIFLYDKKTNTIERFEPYGIINSNNTIDVFFKNKFKEIFNKDIKYLNPSDYFDTIGFQSLSNDHLLINKKIGDPGGYCLAWSLWYIEMRLTNLEYEPYEIIKLSMFKIKNLNKKENPFISFIRNYAYSLNENKNKLLTVMNIEKEHFNNHIFDQNDTDKIINYNSNFFNTI